MESRDKCMVPILWFLIVSFFMFLPAYVHAVEYAEEGKHHAAIGGGFAMVKFDTKFKFTDKESGRSVFVDPEGMLGLPEVSHVNTVYAGYSFSSKHSILFGHFRINREATLFDESLDLGELVNLKGSAKLTDNTRFYHLNYGYSFFKDDRSRVTGVFGIYGMDLRYDFEARGEYTIGDQTESGVYEESVNIFAPLPMFGLNFSWAFTPKWSISTKIQLVGGKYQDIKAGVMATNVNARYKFSKHWGALMGLTYFNANVTIEDDKEKTEITYGYDGAFIGFHVGF